MPLDQVSVVRALISVSDKTGLVDLARALSTRSVQSISTGGTAGALAKEGLEVIDVATSPGFPK